MAVTLEINQEPDQNILYLPREEDFIQWCQLALDAKEKDYEINLNIVSLAKIQELNHTYRSKNKPTNVLSFPFENEFSLDIRLLGDIVVSHEIINKEATEQNKTFYAHWAHIIIHSCLHLMGYDHIIEEEANLMENYEILLLKQLNIANPYVLR